MFQQIALIALFVFSCAPQLSAASLAWDRTEADIEMKPDQEQARATFKLTNRGGKTIRIARIKASCGCTGSIVDRKILKPGDSSAIIGTFNKGKRQGLNRNKLDVYIDSQAEAVATLRMNVQIPTLIEASPQIVYWNAKSTQSPRTVRLNLDERYIDEILRIDYDRSKLVVREEPGDPKTETDRLLHIEPKNYDSLYRGTITIYSSGPEDRTFDMRIHVFVQP